MALYQFPEDLGNSQQGHYMLIDAYRTIEQGNGRPAGEKLDTFAFFIPGGQTNGQSLTWSQQHEYTDVKLARLFTSMLGVAGDVVAGAATLMGVPINPKVDVLFRNTNLREFQFMFLMAPQSSRESDTMQTLLRRFRYHSAPALTSTNYISPNEFEIRFFFINAQGQAEENKYIPKIARGVVKRIDIDYTPTGEWSTFWDGSPVSALLTFTFLETKIIDKNYIDQGY